MNQSWYDHLTPGKVQYGDLYYLLIHYCEDIAVAFNGRYDDFSWMRGLRRYTRYTSLERRLKRIVDE